MSTVNRSNRTGGGVALTCRTGVTVRKVSSSNTRTFEHGIWQLILKNITINVIGVYRPQSLGTEPIFNRMFRIHGENYSKLFKSYDSWRFLLSCQQN